jgi:hypothetical protein
MQNANCNSCRGTERPETRGLWFFSLRWHCEVRPRLQTARVSGLPCPAVAGVLSTTSFSSRPASHNVVVCVAQHGVLVSWSPPMQLQQVRFHLDWHQDSLPHVETQGGVVGDATVGLVAQGLVQGQGRGIVALHLEHQSW